MSAQLLRDLQVVAALGLILLGTPPGASASSVVETFDSASSIDPSGRTLILNTASGRLHPPLRIEGIERNLGDALENPSIEVGDGRHGDFILANYASFSQGGDVSGQIIRLSLADYEELHVKSFVLEAGWTLEPVGEKPLVIRSLSTIQVKGIIQCSGGSGDAGTGAMTTAANGGSGRCGGSRGGQGGGATIGVPLSGSDPLLSLGSGVTGGLVSAAAGNHCLNAGAGVAGRCGGGGGAFSEGGTAGLPSATRGGNNDDKPFAFRTGGAGGGGGLATSGAGSGGGGGGGGGFVELVSVGGIEVEGSVLARGGVGGSSDSLGAGGGGGGGTIMMAAGGEIHFRAGSVVSAEGAAGGATGSAGTTGGRGWIGRTFIVALLPAGPECLSQGVPEIPDRHVTSVGCVRYRTGIFTAQSQVIDLLSSNPELRNISITSSLPMGSALTTNIASSRDAFTAHDSGFQAWTGLPRTLDRFVKFQLSLNNQDSVNGSTIDRIQMDFEPGMGSTFEFRSGCASITSIGGLSESGPLLPAPSLFLFLIPLCLILFLRTRQRFSHGESGRAVSLPSSHSNPIEITPR